MPTADERHAWVAPPAGWPAGIGALTTTRATADAVPAGHFGWNLADHVDDDPAAVAAARRRLLEVTGVRRVQWLQQVHGTGCVQASAATAGTVPQADAAWTRETGLAVAVLTADCVPVVVCDRAGSVVGVAHGGWRGLVGGVLEALLASLPVAAADTVAWLGPAIGPRAFEVGDDVLDAVAAIDQGGALLDQCVRPGRPGKHHLDLFALSDRLLRRAGVGEVLSERLCTFDDPRFFSYRREGSTGRMATLAWLRGPA